jgi:circadian clock protein KaiC
MTTKIQRIPTGIKNLDDVIDGGLVRNSVTMVRGDTGTGKTLFCLQYLYNGAKQFNDAGLFLSFAESAEAIYQHANNFGWNFEELEEKKKFAFIRYSPHEVMKVMEEGGGTIRDTIESFGIKRLVIDSLTAYSLLFESRYKTNESILNLFEMLKGWNCTTLVTAEAPVTISKRGGSEWLGFLTDGIINLYYLRINHRCVRALEIVKMRDTKHSEAIHQFEFTKNGIKVLKGKYVRTKE